MERGCAHLPVAGAFTAPGPGTGTIGTMTTDSTARVWLLYDRDTVVSAHSSEAGARAARLARSDKVRASMGDAWNPSYDEQIEVFPFDVQD